MGKPGVNDRGIFDDAMIVVAPNYYQTFNANTDPGKYKTGIGTVAPGLHFYKKGKHGISGKNPYDAFRPDTDDEGLPGYRDGQKGIKRIITPNLHSGGTINVNSAACQTVKKEQWVEFQTTVYKLMSDAKQKRLPYVLLENK
jgi:lysozyme